LGRRKKKKTIIGGGGGVVESLELRRGDIHGKRDADKVSSLRRQKGRRKKKKKESSKKCCRKRAIAKTVEATGYNRFGVDLTAGRGGGLAPPLGILFPLEEEKKKRKLRGLAMPVKGKKDDQVQREKKNKQRERLPDQ